MASEGANIVRRQWWAGLAALGVAGSVASLLYGVPVGRALVTGGLAVLLGTVAAGWATFRRIAPSAVQAAMGIVVATAARWVVTGGGLVVAFVVDAARPLWIVSGVFLALLATAAAALTYKRH
jgi:hypothetical protein